MAELFKRLSQTSPRVDIVHIFEDGDYVFAHTDYNFNVLEIGFEVFRFEDGLAVEHWDNLQPKHGSLNPSGHTMIDGPTEATDLDKTEVNRELIRSFVSEVLLESPLNEGMRESRRMQPECDGVAEVWFDSEQDLMDAMSSPEGQKLGMDLLEDEKNFIDHSRSSAFIVREHTL